MPRQHQFLRYHLLIVLSILSPLFLFSQPGSNSYSYYQSVISDTLIKEGCIETKGFGSMSEYKKDKGTVSQVRFYKDKHLIVRQDLGSRGINYTLFYTYDGKGRLVSECCYSGLGYLEDKITYKYKSTNNQVGECYEERQWVRYRAFYDYDSLGRILTEKLYKITNDSFLFDTQYHAYVGGKTLYKEWIYYISQAINFQVKDTFGYSIHDPNFYYNEYYREGDHDVYFQNLDNKGRVIYYSGILNEKSEKFHFSYEKYVYDEGFPTSSKIYRTETQWCSDSKGEPEGLGIMRIPEKVYDLPDINTFPKVFFYSKGKK